MAYSSNPITVERMAEYLTPLAGGGEITYRVDPTRLRWFAYKMREVLRLLREHPEMYPEISRDYRIEVASSREVRAVPRYTPIIEVSEGRASPQELGAATMDTVPVVGIDDIIQRWGNSDGQKLYLPKADLTREQLEDLFRWASSHEVMFFENNGALTLMPYDEETAPFAWSPDDD